jgi:hypothetical protein
MDIASWLKEWAVPLSAGATFLLAIAAFWAIWQNYSFRKKDRRFRFQIDVLNEVRNWAAEAVKLGFQYNQSTNNADLHQVVILLNDIAKNTDFADLAIRLFPDELKDAILAVMNVLSIKQRQKKKHIGDKGIIGDDYYFYCLYELMKSVRDVKLRMYNIGKRNK